MRKTLSLLILLLVTQQASAQLELVRAFDETKIIYVKRGRPSFTIKEPNAAAGLVWLLEPYDQRWLTLKSHTREHNDEAIWTFQVAPAAFTAPHVLKLRLLLGDPETLEAYEYHDFVIMTR